MNEHTSIRNQSCPNKLCRFYGETLEGNVIVHSQRARRMKCKECGKTWVSHRKEIRYGLRSDAKQIELAIEMFKSEMSIRKIAREIGVSTSTVQRWKARMKSNSIFY